MPAKQLEIAPVGTVKLYKRKDARSIKITIRNGYVRVTLPYWLPYRAGIDFVKSRADWVNQNMHPAILLSHGQQIGKAHRLQFYPGSRQITSRVTTTEIKIFYPQHTPHSDNKVQAAAQAACVRALKTEADTLLPQRLRQLAIKHNFRYTTVKTRQLKSRWGSCSQQKQISLNIFLMQLPWHLIDYVLLHELTHTKFLNHSQAFWRHMQGLTPGVSQLRKELRLYQPTI